MGDALNSKDYKAEYEKALLAEALSGVTLKTKATLLVFSSLLLVVMAYDLELKAIPGLSIHIPDGVPSPIEGMLALSCFYLLIQFVFCFFQDYFRWRLHQEIVSVSHSGAVLSELKKSVDNIKGRFSSLEPLIEHKFHENIDALLERLDGRSKQVIGIGRSHNALWSLQVIRFWVLDLVVPLILAGVAILSSGNAGVGLLQVVRHAL